MSQLTNVRVIRYIRPYVYSKVNNTTNEIMHLNNMGGITILFDMDYVKRIVSIRFSICCDDENFDKDVGRFYAETADPAIYDLNKFRKLADGYGGFTDAFIAILRFAQLSEKVPTRVKKFLQKVDEYNVDVCDA